MAACSVVDLSLIKKEGQTPKMYDFVGNFMAMVEQCQFSSKK